MYIFNLFLGFLCNWFAPAKGYDIEVTLLNAPNDTLYLGYYYADKQYIKDTVVAQNGIYHFKKDSALLPGVYLLVMPPKNEFIQIFINQNEQNLVIHADMKDITKTIKFKGSLDNELFYGYLNFLDIQRPAAQRLSESIKSEKDSSKIKALQAQLELVNTAVRDKQKELVSHYPQSITAMLIRSTFEINFPEFKGESADIEMKKYLYYKAHYFDNINVTDDRIIRSPLLHDRMEYYVEKLTVQDPDSINKSLDYLYALLKPNDENFKFYLIHFLNKYATSKVVGFDAVYVHLVDEYYSKGFAPWIDSTQLAKMQNNSASLRPILIGKTAPEIKVMRYPDQSALSLHSIKSPYTILFIWDPECSHCKASLPIVVKFYDKWKSKGVEVLAICTQFTDKVPNCWKYLDEQKIAPGWINAADPYHQSKYKVLYDVKSTPQFFILDANKKILVKGVGAEQLEEVMDHLTSSKM